MSTRTDDILSELPTLVRLAQTGSISHAARDLGVPRSTISRRLARLEAALGVALAERTTRSFRLTDEGRRLANGAAGLLAQLQTLREDIEHSAGSVRGWLRVCTPPGLGGPLLGRFLVSFRTRFPDVRLQLTVREHVPHLLDEPFDVVFALGPLQDAPWLRHKIGKLWYVAVAHPHALTGPPPATLDDLTTLPIVAARSGDLSTDCWPTLDQATVRIDPHFVTSDLSAAADAARAGMGVAMLPVHLVASDLTEGTLVPVLPHVLGRHQEVYVLYPPERRDSPVIRALLDAVDDFGDTLAAEMPSGPNHQSTRAP